MQPFTHAPQQAQLPLFEAFLAQPVLPGDQLVLEAKFLSRKSMIWKFE
ncbi:MAG: hypothetical protein H5U33_21050, partial [Pseudomonas sp.]|nr:hypothetical protein [Pseudomonas sp.]